MPVESQHLDMDNRGQILVKIGIVALVAMSLLGIAAHLHLEAVQQTGFEDAEIEATGDGYEAYIEITTYNMGSDRFAAELNTRWIYIGSFDTEAAAEEAIEDNMDNYDSDPGLWISALAYQTPLSAVGVLALYHWKRAKKGE